MKGYATAYRSQPQKPHQRGRYHWKVEVGMYQIDFFAVDDESDFTRHTDQIPAVPRS